MKGLNTTWEVRRKFFSWKTVYTCNDYGEAFKEMNHRRRGWGQFFQWELRGYSGCIL